MESSFDGGKLRPRLQEKKNSRPRPYRLENIFEPEKRRRAAKKFGEARVTTYTDIDHLRSL